MSKPNHSFREDPEIVEVLMKHLGVNSKTEAVTKAIRIVINMSQVESNLSKLSDFGQDLAHDYRSAKEIADILGISPKTVKRMVTRGILVGGKLGAGRNSAYIVNIYSVHDYLSKLLRPNITVVSQT